MIATLLITIIAEGAVVTGFCLWRRKPIYPIFVSSACANLITQSFLWIVLNIFFNQYLIALLVAEILIWMAESLLLYSIRANYLSFIDAILLSLSMNLMSFTFGLFLTI